jgi:hypothetical protein
VRAGTVPGIGQSLAEGESAALLGDGLAQVALFVEQVGEGAERLGTPCGMVLEDLEAGLQLGLSLGVAAQIAKHNGAVHPSGGDVLRRTLQRSLHLQDGIDVAQGRFPVLLGELGLPGDVERADERAGEKLGIGRLRHGLAGAVLPPPDVHLRQPGLYLR